MPRLTFTKEPCETGLSAVAHPYGRSTVIKLDGKQCGTIAAPHWSSTDSLWSVRFAVKTADNWKWVTVKERFATEPDARAWVKANQTKILALNLHQFEE